ncbi:unnamed protein product [Darwinula stevensoni]|uniref:Uncharacterized protein n=1 Tax=Darwinula stevensoni TaxID=69355 RepID=A0A7R8X9E9_9CRUS|nr:unnamed protein product [Darwinula stevensoni]CAG0891043.1 unnamed protein product [Darwinula stevensoni]
MLSSEEADLSNSEAEGSADENVQTAGPQLYPGGPQLEPLKIDVKYEGLPPDIVLALRQVKQAAKTSLFHWKSFPIQVPEPISRSQSEGPRSSQSINPNELFVEPSFEELDRIALDSQGQLKKLTPSQIECIRQEGEFEVESVNFPGQVHRWRLCSLLQKGKGKTEESLQEGLALSLCLIIISAKNRFVSDNFSVRAGIRSLKEGLCQLLDALIGLPSLGSKGIMERLQEERAKYLVVELLCQSSDECDLDGLCHFIKDQVVRREKELEGKVNDDVDMIPPCPPIPLVFRTPKGSDVDLRLFDRQLMRRLSQILVGILERETKGWFLHFKEQHLAKFKDQLLSDADIEKETNLAVMDEYLRRVFRSILENPDIAAPGEGLGKLLVEQAKSVILMGRAMDNVHEMWNRTWLEKEKRLKINHPILSKIPAWMEERLLQAEAEFVAQHQWSAHEEALSLCRDHNLNQTLYFLSRDLIFMKEREPVLMKELQCLQEPTRTYRWYSHIWDPKKWVIHCLYQGQCEVIPTVVSNQTAPMTRPRSALREPTYFLEKFRTRTTSSRWLFWRWLNFIHCFYSWTNNAFYFFGYVIPWTSPISLQALISAEPFMADYELSQASSSLKMVNGSLCPQPSSTRQTLQSQLRLLWKHVSHERTSFKSKPSMAFLGNEISRHANWSWNYVLKGGLGSLFLCIFFPLTCLLVCCASLLLTIAAPIWMLVLVLGFHLFKILIYDLDSPELTEFSIQCQYFSPIILAVVWKIVILGIIQPIIAFLLGAIVCPILAAFVLLAGFLQYYARLAWDWIMLETLIKRLGRIPAVDTLFASRVAGPGLGSNFYYQITVPQALASLELRIEGEELRAYAQQMEKLIRKPQEDLRRFIQQVFQPFSATVTSTGIYLQLEKEAMILLQTLEDRVRRRTKELTLQLPADIRNRVRMPDWQLKLALHHGASMLCRHYPSRVLSRLSTPPTEFWEEKGLLVEDWPGLAALFFSEIFSPGFLCVLEDGETRFQLESHLDLSRFEVEATHFPEDMSSVMLTCHKRKNITIHSPYLHTDCFNPTVRPFLTRKTQTRKRTGPLNSRTKFETEKQKLMIPLPIPHPVLICALIYNRDNEESVPLESRICQHIMADLERSRPANAPPTDITSMDTDALSIMTSQQVSHHNLHSVTLNLVSPNEVSVNVTSHGDTRALRGYGTLV